ncbi:GntR family transcriptional regulator [Anaerococcus sp.]|uniref:GntR family transcriptional regulator n=1 Tax=Anaerococcus sp. TaxID=1872515 RepID=UPI002A75E4A3|nr:GntR family transcriptional regulator [Anaerococcus sp.]MDD6919476.1 GntR family transcriptional regulator [Peptoniphilaceae bacterium]MDY2927460.1 GntR family transcriptional regulator [Anaerococcus sp.]
MNFKVLDKKSKEKSKEYVIRNMVYNIEFLNLEPGEKISENQISDFLNLSRTPIREAFYNLKSNLLIDVKPQIGTFISYLDIDVSKELLFFRSSLEEKAVIEVCNKDSLDYLNVFKEIIEKEKTLHDSNNIEELISLDNRFHNLIFEELGYNKIPSIIEDNTYYLVRMRILRLKANIREKNYIDEHENILKYMINKDKENASKILKYHINELVDDMNLLRNKYPHYFKDNN